MIFLSFVFNTIRDQLRTVPFLGIATSSLHLLLNGVYFSALHLYKGSEKSLTADLFKHLVGQNLFDFVADRVVELIYHPSWRITIMHLINSLLKYHLLQDDPQLEDSEEVMFKQFETIAAFLANHALDKKNKVLTAPISIVAPIAAVHAYHAFNTFLSQPPPKTSFKDTLLAASIPTIKELTLYCKVTDLFRKDFVTFDGDSKFWEVFIRESLNQLVKKRNDKTREQCIDHLLSLPKTSLQEFLAELPPPEVFEDPMVLSDSQNIGGRPIQVLEDYK